MIAAKCATSRSVLHAVDFNDQKLPSTETTDVDVHLSDPSVETHSNILVVGGMPVEEKELQMPRHIAAKTTTHHF